MPAHRMRGRDEVLGYYVTFEFLNYMKLKNNY
jgi:hypothetical protein